jgi:hypothetical protein
LSAGAVKLFKQSNNQTIKQSLKQSIITQEIKQSNNQAITKAIKQSDNHSIFFQLSNSGVLKIIVARNLLYPVFVVILHFQIPHYGTETH